MDEMIHSQSEAYQSQFLQGSIPKVIFKHAMKGSLSLCSLIHRMRRYPTRHVAPPNQLRARKHLRRAVHSSRSSRQSLDRSPSLSIFSLAGPFSLECAHSLSSLACRPSAFARFFSVRRRRKAKSIPIRRSSFHGATARTARRFRFDLASSPR